jgi:Response regulator containing a CheY-like receiver domain and an HTH DNA-binding domain
MHVQSAPSPTVCLLTSNPLTIAECQGLLYLADYTLRVKRIELGDHAAEEIPSADIYAVEVRPTPEATQEVVVRILSREPHARVLVIGESFDEANAFPLLTMGVKGIVRRSELKADLTRALSAVHQNGFWVPRQLLSKFIGNVLHSTRRMLFALGSSELTESQASLLNSLLQTESDDELARKLSVSEVELKSRVAELMRKFNVRRRYDLVLLAHQATARAS